MGSVSFVAGGGDDFVDGEGCGVGFSDWEGWRLGVVGLGIGVSFCLLGWLLLLGRVLHGDGDGWRHEGPEVFG